MVNTQALSASVEVSNRTKLPEQLLRETAPWKSCEVVIVAKGLVAAVILIGNANALVDKEIKSAARIVFISVKISRRNGVRTELCTMKCRR